MGVMAKIHLILKKEDIDLEQMKDNKIAVVFDVLLATSTIAACLHYGAKEVIPVMNGEEARAISMEEENDCLLVGEYEGKTIDQFHAPFPLSLKEHVRDKIVILSTTNGTVAIKRSIQANKVYTCSLLNGLAVANVISRNHQDETLIVVCSGSSGEFNIEDFYGAGHFINHLMKNDLVEWELSDAALAAMLFYQGNEQSNVEILTNSRVGEMLARYNAIEDCHYVAKKDLLDVVPVLREDGRLVNEIKSMSDVCD